MTMMKMMMMVMLRWARVSVGVWVAVGVVAGTLGTTDCPGIQTSQNSICQSVGVAAGEGSPQQVAVLQEMCWAGSSHVHTGARRPQFPKENQFAVVNLHRDSFIGKAKWISGDAQNVICERGWYVDEEVSLSNGYRWYRHGLPMWPMHNQAMFPKKKFLDRVLNRGLSDVWPNYAIATPLYLIPYEKRNWRDPRISFGKLFEKINNSTFKKFHKTVWELYKLVKDVDSEYIEDSVNWFLFLVRHSLPSMLQSFKKKQKFCPDNLYVFFGKHRVLEKTVRNETESILIQADCPYTELVIGYSQSL